MSAFKKTPIALTTPRSKFNRPKALNSFGGRLMPEIVSAIRYLDTHPDTTFTVLTGAGRFFSSGADVKATGFVRPESDDPSELKIAYLSRFATNTEMMRAIVDHRKIFVLALNGPGVGGGSAWFPGVSDIVLAAEGAYLQTPFSALGLVPENGGAVHFAQSIGVHRANDFFMFGRQVTVEEMERWGMVNRIFPKDGFHEHVVKFLEEQLEVNDGASMIETKRLQNLRLRDQRMIAVYNAMDALAERFVDGAPIRRFAEKKKMMEGKSSRYSESCRSIAYARLKVVLPY